MSNEERAEIEKQAEIEKRAAIEQQVALDNAICAQVHESFQKTGYENHLHVGDQVQINARRFVQRDANGNLPAPLFTTAAVEARHIAAVESFLQANPGHPAAEHISFRVAPPEAA